MINISTTQFNLQEVISEEEFFKRISFLIQKALEDKSSLLILPEYFSLSLLLFQTKEKNINFKEALHQEGPSHSQKLLKKAQELSSHYKIDILLGTLPVKKGSHLVNRSYFLTSDGGQTYQDKINMTRFEKEVWAVQKGDPLLHLFYWKGFKCAMLTCYDSEFAYLSTYLSKAQVELLFVPSCTDTEHGYWRVRHCCEARAIENQMFVVMSSVVGGNKKFQEIDSHYGRGALFSPCDGHFNPSGLIIEGLTNQEGVVTGELNRQELLRVRQSGDVLNLSDSNSENYITVLDPVYIL